MLPHIKAYCQAKQKYPDMFGTQNAPWTWQVQGLKVPTLDQNASPKMGQDNGSRGASVPCRLAAPFIKVCESITKKRPQNEFWTKGNNMRKKYVNDDES